MSDKVELDGALVGVYIATSNAILEKMRRFMNTRADSLGPITEKCGEIAREGTNLDPTDAGSVLGVTQSLVGEMTKLLSALSEDSRLLIELAGDAGNLSIIGNALFQGETLAQLKARLAQKSPAEVVDEQVRSLFEDMDPTSQN